MYRIGGLGKGMTERSRIRSQRGITLLEIMIAMGVLAIGLFGMVLVILQSSRMTAVQEENLLAMRSAQNMIEQMENTNWDQIYTNFSGNPDFPVTGLEPQVGDPDGFEGKILFPEIGGALDETIADIGWNMPMDLNGDGDAADPVVLAGEYVILPVRISVSWTGRSGDRVLSFNTILIYRTP